MNEDIKKQELLEILNDLKNNHFANAIKAEFEDEGASFEEVSELRKFAEIAGLEFTLKIGGCGALNDIQKAKDLDVDTIVAPMIESPYALKKFVVSVKKIYEGTALPKLFVNIETIYGYKNFDKILSSSESESVDGVVVGRFDMAKSISLGCKDIHGEEISNIVRELSQKTKNYNKVFVVGGGINEKSLEFFGELDNIEKFETRKIVFSANDVLKSAEIAGIINAMKFELAWLEYKLQNFDCNELVVLGRISSLKARFDGILKAEKICV